MDIPELREFYNSVVAPLLHRFFTGKPLAPTLAFVRTHCPKGQHYIALIFSFVFFKRTPTQDQKVFKVTLAQGQLKKKMAKTSNPDW